MSDQTATDQQEEILDDILPEFLVEADDLLESLNEHLLKLDEGVKGDVNQDAPACDKELLNEVFRSAHTLKGLSGMFGFTDINQLTHKVENIFDAARSDQLPVTEDIVDVIFRAIDHVSAMVEDLRQGEVGGVDAEAIQAEIQAVLEATGTAKSTGTDIDLDAAMAEALEKENAAAAVEEAGESKTDDADIDLDAALAQAFEAQDPKKTSGADAVPTTNEDPASEDPTIVEATTVPDASTSSEEIAESAPELESATTTEPEESAVYDEDAPTQSTQDNPFADVSDDENIPANYLAIFVDETETSLDSLTELLLDGFDEKVAEHLLVNCHRIKGSAASIGLNRAAALGHVMEDLLQDLEQEKRQPTAEMADALLSCIDALRGHVNELRQGICNVFDFQAAYDQLIAARSSGDNQSTTEPAQPETTASAPTPEPIASEADAEDAEAADDGPTSTPDVEIESAAPVPVVQLQFEKEEITKVTAAAPTNSDALAVQIGFRPDLLLVGLKARLLHEKLSQYGDVFYCDPPEETLDDIEELSQLVLGVSTQESISEFESSLSLEGVQQINFEKIVRKPAEADDTSAAATRLAANAIEPAIAKAAALDSAAAKSASASPAAEAKSTTTSAKATVSANESAGKPVETVRVDIERLDQLMNMAGQLVINKARFSQISASMKRSVGAKSNINTVNELTRSIDQLRKGLDDCSQKNSFDDNIETMQTCVRRVHASMEQLQHQLKHFDDMRLSVNDLFEAVHQLDRVADGIQKGVMDTRMVPVGPLFGRFKRVIRDISHSSGKKIRLEIRGENTELDKRMIDELGDPLIHIVRNSADHGIESPEDREAAGKQIEGTVILDAAHRGNSIVIEIIDDGKGLDTDRIRDKAIEKGVIAAADAEKLSDYQIHQLIWEPGFSTAEQVTNVSGRGMGMDIVRSKIEEINGVVEMHSTAGEGTRIAIKLPLTLAILPSLLAEIEGDVFAVPVESVSEIVSLAPGELSTVHSLPTATVRGQTISVVYLSSLFRWSHPAKRTPADGDAQETILVIVESEGQLLGLVVDCLLGEEDIVIKSLAENYQNVDGVAGASILGDGRVALILDPNAMLVAASGQAELQTTV